MKDDSFLDGKQTGPEIMHSPCSQMTALINDEDIESEIYNP